MNIKYVELRPAYHYLEVFLKQLSNKDIAFHVKDYEPSALIDEVAHCFEIFPRTSNCRDKLIEWLDNNFTGNFIVSDHRVRLIMSNIGGRRSMRNEEEEKWTTESYYLHCNDVDATLFKLTFG